MIPIILFCMGPLYISLVIVIVSLGAGLLPQVFANKISSQSLTDLTGFASGLLLASAFLVVVPEGFHTAATGDGVFSSDPLVMGLAALAGFIVLLALEGLGIGHAVHEEHHDHATGHGHEHVHHPFSGRVIAIGLSAHALADGVAIGAAAAAGETSFSLLVAFAVVVHRVPAALSLGIFLLHQPGGRRSALKGLLLFTFATPAALALSYLVLNDVDESILALVLLFSAGTFVYVATIDTLPAIHNPATGQRSVRNVLSSAAVLSIILILLNNAGVLEHSHLEGDYNHDDVHVEESL
jgi:zinc transporter ZupT